jgi:CubicO group peptidase (beta-lactamase class C family)
MKKVAIRLGCAGRGVLSVMAILRQLWPFHLLRCPNVIIMMWLAPVTFLLGIFACVAAVAGEVAPQKVDDIFAAYNRTGSPGCSLGVVRNGDFVYRKAYGLGNLELGTSLSPQSVFYMGSVSKQFTAAAAVLAGEQGYLSLDDDVRKFIPELPDYGHVITLRQIIHQTSGLRDFFSLIDLSGHDVADFNSKDEIFKLVLRQTGLNNVPGDEWIYSNTNYFLLGIVVERATKKSLAQFAAQSIFQPLGMSHTLFYDDHFLVVPGRVAAYDSGPHDTFQVDWSTTYDIVGGGGLMSTVDDLLLWDRNFYTNRLGATLTEQLQTRGVLSNGNNISYAMGLDLGNYRGLPIVEHSGALFGYRTALLRFPEQKFTVICLCNISSAVPENLARKVADLYLADKLLPGSSALSPSGSGDLPTPETFAGKYLDPRTHLLYSFTVSDGKLMAWGGVLRRISAEKFYDLQSNIITFERYNGGMKARLDIQGETYFAGHRIEERRLNSADLAVYVGQFRSPELDATYSVSLEQGILSLVNRDTQPQKLTPIAPDEFDANDLGRIVFHRDRQGRVSGLSMFTQDVRGVEFNRLN